MADPKTKPTKASVAAFLKKAAKGDRLADCQAVAKLMQKASGEKPVMWGEAIVGFGSYAIKYAGGETVDWPVAAFSPRATALVLYGMRASPKHAALLKKLGRHSMAGGCLHLKALADVDVKVLDKLITSAVKARKAKK